MSLYYVDTSAALKLLAEASHSRAFAKFYDESAGASWVSSALLRVEVIRAVSRAMPAALPDARALLQAFDYVSIDDEVAGRWSLRGGSAAVGCLSTERPSRR